MMKETRSALENARNLGTLTARELNRAGIHSLEELRSLGWEEAFARWVEHSPERLNLNAATALIGAIEDVDWREVRAEDKARARKLISALKRA